MIRNFHMDDLKIFKPNEFSDPADVMFIFEGENFYKETMVVNGVIKAILCFTPNGNDDWAGFFMISECFTARDGVRVKKWFDKKIKQYKPKRVWTASQQDCVLETWHKFLGMVKERTQIINDKECNIWSVTWGSKQPY